MNLQFVNGWVLLLVWAVLALAAGAALIFRRKQAALKAFLAEPMLAKLAPPARPAFFYWQVFFAGLGLCLLLAAAARPQWGSEEKQVFQRGRDLIIALDVSRSMLARDVHPNRLLRAKADIQDLLRELRGDRVALVTFRGKAIPLCPLTVDYAYLEQILDDVTTESAPRGETNIGDAIYKALAAFESDAGSHRAMILISDGEDLAGQAKAAAEKAKEKGVVIFTVGLGNPEGTTIPGLSKSDPRLTYQGKEVITRLHHETLREIAEITGGAYVPVGVANVKLGKLYREHLSKITARDIEESLQKRMIERYQMFLFAGVLALLVSAFFSRGRLALRKPSARRPAQNTKTFFPYLRAAKLILFLIFTGTLAHGQAGGTPAITAGAPQSAAADRPAALQNFVRTNAAAATPPPAETFAVGREGARRAQKYYRQGAFEKSVSAYQQAASNASARLQNDCLFNAGCAAYRGNDYRQAADCFSQLVNRENADPAKASYNLGCALFRLAEEAEKKGTNSPPALTPALLENSGGAFQRSLRSRPDFAPAAANLAAITNRLPKAREEAKLRALLARYGNQPPAALADSLLQNQRNIRQALPPVLTNAAPTRINQFENLAGRQRENSDLLIPLKLTLAAAGRGQDQRQMAQLAQHLEATRNAMDEGFNKLREIDNQAWRPVAAAERGVYNLWKGLAAFEKLLREDLRRQTNAIGLTASVLAEIGDKIDAVQEEQQEARELTRLFSERFAQAVPPPGTTDKKLPGLPSAPLPEEDAKFRATNAPPQISAATRTNILYLADQARKAQGRAGDYLKASQPELSLPEQRRSYELLEEIEKLLPKDKSPPPDQQKQDQQQQQPQQKDQAQPPPEQKPPAPPKEDEQKPPPEPPPPEQKPQQPEEPPAEPGQKDEKELTAEQLDALLDKARQREKEHREEKMRDEYIPPSPVDRDW